MNIKEITINVPITIKTDDNGEIEVGLAGQEQQEQEQEQEPQTNPVMVTPLQQELELKKAELDKESPVIDKITQSDDIGAEANDTDDSMLGRIKQLITKL